MRPHRTMLDAYPPMFPPGWLFQLPCMMLDTAWHKRQVVLSCFKRYLCRKLDCEQADPSSTWESGWS